MDFFETDWNLFADMEHGADVAGVDVHRWSKMGLISEGDNPQALHWEVKLGNAAGVLCGMQRRRNGCLKIALNALSRASMSDTPRCIGDQMAAFEAESMGKCFHVLGTYRDISDTGSLHTIQGPFIGCLRHRGRRNIVLMS